MRADGDALTRTRAPSLRDAAGPMGLLRAEKVRSVSVVTVCFNARDCIRLTLESVRRQTFGDVQHVVIDGGSTDGTQEIVREYDVAYFISERDKGIYDAMDKGARAAQGDIVIFLNAGDLFYDNTVCADVASFFTEARADLVFGDLCPAYLRPSDTHDHDAFRPGQRLNLGYYANRRFLYTESIHHQATFYRRWILRHCTFAAPEPEATGEYHLLMCAVLKRNATVKYMPRVVSRFMLGGASTKNFAEEWSRYVRARDLLRARFCPDPDRIPVSAPNEFHHLTAVQARTNRRQKLKAVVKATPFFKVYDRVTTGLSARSANAVRPLIDSVLLDQQRLAARTQESARELERRLDDLAGRLEVDGHLLLKDALLSQGKRLAAMEARLEALEHSQAQRAEENADLLRAVKSGLSDAIAAVRTEAKGLEGAVRSETQGVAATVRTETRGAVQALRSDVAGYSRALLDAQGEAQARLTSRLDLAEERTGLALATITAAVGRGEDFADHGFRSFSQWDEDGLIQFLVQRVALGRRAFVEIGVGDYREANTRLLLLKDNWSGLIVDCDAAAMASVQAEPLFWRHTLGVRTAFVTAENVNDILTEAGMTGDIGLLSIDIDGMDYWVWKAVTAAAPRIVVCEYNGLLGCGAQLTVPYQENFDRRTAHSSWLYAGASLPALIALGAEKGYQFIGVNLGGNNAFFVRADLAKAASLQRSRRRFVKPMFREARHPDGSLSFKSVEEAAPLIADMPFLDVATGQMVRLGERPIQYTDG